MTMTSDEDDVRVAGEERRVRVKVGYAVTKDQWSYETTVEMSMHGKEDFNAEAFQIELAKLQDIARTNGEAEVMIRTHHDEQRRLGHR